MRLFDDRRGGQRCGQRVLSGRRISTRAAGSAAQGTLGERIRHQWHGGRRRLLETSMNRPRSRRLRQAFYRFFDVTCAAAGLLLLMPLLAALAVFILWNDGPPILFSQTRVGRRGKPFRIWKFRMMRAGSQGSAITAAGDSRVSRPGAVLRRYKLDELPQLFNVLKGDMSLVGPRPEAPEYVQLESPIWQAVLQVRPGVT